MSSPRILVVEDDEWTIRMLCAILEKGGYTVDTAHNGEEALDQAVRERPDLIITDVMMPKMDGWSLVQSLRARGEFAFVPVIFLSALATEDDRIRGFRLGADDYLAKPFRFEELELRIARTLERSGALERMARSAIGSDRDADTNSSLSRIDSDLAGTLEQVGLAALLTLMEMERKTGILQVIRLEPGEVPPDDPHLPGSVPIMRVFLRKGRIYKVRKDGAKEPVNEDCIYDMLEWPSGSFAFAACEVNCTDEIGESTQYLLMEGARIIDERNAE